jgi:hypothetical protein
VHRNIVYRVPLELSHVGLMEIRNVWSVGSSHDNIGYRGRFD